MTLFPESRRNSSGWSHWGLPPPTAPTVHVWAAGTRKDENDL